MPFEPINPQAYRGVRAPTPINLWSRKRAPDAQDLALYTIGDLWYDKIAIKFWILIDTGSFGALWVPITSSAASGILTINNISADGLGNFSLVAGANITLTPGANSLTISSTGGGVSTWQVIAASQMLSVNTGYICAGGGALVLQLPAVSVLGDIIEVTLDGSASYQITQGAGQQIRFGGVQTTLGAGGSLMTNVQGDTLRLVCQTANSRWNVLSDEGNFTVV